MKSMKKIIKSIYFFIFKEYHKYLAEQLQGMKSVLDVGCGSNSPLALIKKDFYSVGVDLHQASIEKSKKQAIHDDYKMISVLDIDKEFAENSFDCVIANDLIEHLSKEDGEKLIKAMEKIAKKRVVIFTPNGFLEQGIYDNNPWQKHLSGWEVDEMRSKNYKVIGFNGLKSLRGEYAKILNKPQKLWLLISDISQFFVKNKPENAFHILCVKDL